MSKKCRVCQIRNIGTGNPGNGPFAEDAAYARSVELCRPCATEAGWENMHADGDHETEACWVCCPELNRATVEAAQVAGTSRAGMTINVPIRADGATKAATVAERIGGRVVRGTKRNGGVTRLELEFAGGKLTLAWDAAGRYLYDRSDLNGKKVRNVSAALRAVATAA